MESFEIKVFESKITVSVDKNNPAFDKAISVIAEEQGSNEGVDAIIQKALHRIGYLSYTLDVCNAESLILKLSKLPSMYTLDGSRGIKIEEYTCAKPIVTVKKK